jgi:hypothetical protein
MFCSLLCLCYVETKKNFNLFLFLQDIMQIPRCNVKVITFVWPLNLHLVSQIAKCLFCVQMEPFLVKHFSLVIGGMYQHKL